MNNFNNLTPAEEERIALLMEECAEVIQICGKILRHGYESYSPFDETGTTNRALLEKELGDVEFSSSLMKSRNDVDGDSVDSHFWERNNSVWRYLHHNERGY